MPGNITPAQMFTHELNAVKGWPNPYALDFRANVSSTNTVQFNAGAGAWLDESGDFRIGSNPGAVTIFLRQGINSFDANSDVGNISGGEYAGLVCLGAFELYTTEFVPNTYVPNDFLKVSNVSDSTKGQVKIGVAYTDTLCGIVSKAAYTNKNGVNVLQFWTYYLPPLAIESSTGL